MVEICLDSLVDRGFRFKNGDRLLLRLSDSDKFFKAEFCDKGRHHNPDVKLCETYSRGGKILHREGEIISVGAHQLYVDPEKLPEEVLRRVNSYLEVA